MGCCHEPPHLHYRSVLPKRYVLPVRVIVLISLIASSLYILRHIHDLSPTLIIGLFFHLLIAARALSECRKSVHYHQLLAEFEEKINSQE